MSNRQTEPIQLRQPDSTAAQWTVFFFLPAIWFIPCLLFTVIVAIFTGMAFIPPGWMVAPVLALFVAYSIDRTIHHFRVFRARRILGYLDQAITLNLPLDAFLLAAQNSERGAASMQLQRLREGLQAGYPIHAALDDALPDLPPEHITTLATAESIGQLQPSLKRIVENDRRSHNPDEAHRAAYQRFYPLGLLLFITTVITLYMIFIVPKFREIFKDFKIDLPPLTEFVLNVSTMLVQNGALATLLLLILIFAFVAPMSYYLHRVILPFWRLPPLGNILQIIRWWIPFLHRVEVSQAMAETMEFLAQATRAGIPLDTAVERSLYLPTNPYVRRKIRTWADLLQQGNHPADAARKAGLPELLAGLLAPGATGQGLPDMFAFLGRYYRDRFSRALILVRAAVEPAVVLLFGAIVALFTASMIIPLAALLNGVNETYPTSHL